MRTFCCSHGCVVLLLLVMSGCSTGPNIMASGAPVWQQIAGSPA